MKDITTKIKKFVKNKVVKPTLMTAAAVALSYNLSGQVQKTETKTETPIEYSSTIEAKYDTLVGTPDSDIYYPFKRPAVHEYIGKLPTEYYSSGDVDLSGDVDSVDVNLIRAGVKNDMADVAKPYGIIDTADANTIERYVNFGKKFIGKDFWSDDFTKEDRAEYISNLYDSVYMKEFDLAVTNHGDSILDIIGWNCTYYATQALIDFNGMTDIQAFLDEYYPDTTKIPFKQENNARFNIYSTNVKTFTDSIIGGGGHVIIGFPIGKKLEKIDNWLFIDGETGYRTEYGGLFLNKRANIDWNGIRVDHPARGPPLVYFEGDTPDIDPWVSASLNTQPDSLAPTYTPVNNDTASYNDFISIGLDSIVEKHNPNDVVDNVDPNPVIAYDFNDNQTNEGIYSDYNFDAEVNFKATDFENNDSISKYNIFIRDLEGPSFDVPADVDYNYEVGLNTDTSRTGSPTNINDNAKVVSIGYDDESNQIVDGSINEVNYIVSRNWNVTDISGNITSKIQKINIADNEKPKIGVSNNYIKISSSEDAVKAVKSLVNYTYDNSNLPLDTIATYTTENYYDVQARDVAGNLSEAVEVKVDKSDGIGEISNLEKMLYTAYPNPVSRDIKVNCNPNSPDKTHVEIYSTDGRLVKNYVEHGFVNNFEMDLSNLSSGIYLMQITQGDKTKTQKIIKK